MEILEWTLNIVEIVFFAAAIICIVRRWNR